MIAELMRSYSAVVCRQCNEPIPVSPRIVSLHDESEREETNAARSFIIRCKLCECESVYAVSDIRRLNGEPRRRKPRARAAGA
jgi:hypothetical protein